MHAMFVPHAMCK